MLMNLFRLLIAGFFIFLTLNVLARGEKYVLFEENNKFGLRTSKGETVIPAQYQKLGWSNGSPEVIDDLIGFREKGNWGVMNLKNEVVVSPNFKTLFPHNEDVLIASKLQPTNQQEVYSLLDYKGKPKSDHSYHKLISGGSNIIAIQKNGDQYIYGLINPKGDVVIPFKFVHIKALGEHMYAIKNHDYKVALMNGKGTQMIPFEIDSTRFIDNYIVYFKNGKAGLTTSTGNILFSPQYRKIEVEEGKVRVQIFPEWSISGPQHHISHSFDADSLYAISEHAVHINLNNYKSVLQLDGEKSDILEKDVVAIKNNLAIYEKNKRYGVRNLSGSHILDAKYDSIKITDQYIIAHNNIYGQRGWYLLSHDGVSKNKEAFQHIEPINDQYIKVRQNNFFGVLNKWGDVILECRYDSIEAVCGDLYLVHFYNEKGIKNKYGEWITLPEKQHIEFIGDSSYLVRTIEGSYHKSLHGTDLLRYDGYLFIADFDLYKVKDYYNGYGFISYKGEVMVYPEYDSISPLINGNAYIATRDTLHTFIDKDGNILHKDDPRFEEIVGLNEDFVGVKIDGKYGFVDLQGNLRVSNQYQNIQLYQEGRAAIQIRDSWGFIDKSEIIIVQPFYDEVSTFQNGIAIVSKSNKYGLIDRDGTYLIRPEFDLIELLPNGLYKTRQNGKMGLIDRNGNTIVLPRFNSIELLKNQWMIVERNGKYGVISDEGIDMIPMIYDRIIYNSGNNNYFLKQKAKWKTIKS
jgi:hypothetical protein